MFRRLSKRVENTVGKEEIAPYEQFLAPLAKGQQAIVMALCPSSVKTIRLSIHACVRPKVFLQKTSPQKL